MYTLQVIADKLNIRNSPNADALDNWVGDMSNGEIFKAVNKVKGAPVDGIDDWYVDDLNRYTSAAWVNDVTNVQDWMVDLQLPQIWKKFTGKGIGIAVVDTGIVLNNAEIPFDKNVFGSYKINTTINDLADSFGHGTECAGIIGARNSNGNYVGVAPGCNLHVYKISETNNFNKPNQPFNEQDALRYAAAIDWCASRAEIKIISISWSTALFEDTVIKKIQDSVNAATKNNKIIVTARGNNNLPGTDTSAFYPACLDNVISVGMIPTANHFNFTGHIDIITQGANIGVYNLQNQLAADAGTSMATAVIAGITALILEKEGLQKNTTDVKQILNRLSINSDSLSRLSGALLSKYFN
jgi:subtilisin family serine protease